MSTQTALTPKVSSQLVCTRLLVHGVARLQGVLPCTSAKNRPNLGLSICPYFPGFPTLSKFACLKLLVSPDLQARPVSRAPFKSRFAPFVDFIHEWRPHQLMRSIGSTPFFKLTCSNIHRCCRRRSRKVKSSSLTATHASKRIPVACGPTPKFA